MPEYEKTTAVTCDIRLVGAMAEGEHPGLGRHPRIFSQVFVKALRDMAVPSPLTIFEAFTCRDQSAVRHIDPGLIAFPGDVPDDAGAFPFGPVFYKMQVAIRDMPYHPFVGNEFGQFKGDKGLPKTYGKDVVKGFGITLEILRPPCGNPADGFEGFCGAGIYADAVVIILLFHVICF